MLTLHKHQTRIDFLWAKYPKGESPHDEMQEALDPPQGKVQAKDEQTPARIPKVPTEEIDMDVEPEEAPVTPEASTEAMPQQQSTVEATEQQPPGDEPSPEVSSAVQEAAVQEYTSQC